MPGTPRQLNDPRFGPYHTALIQGVQTANARAAASAAGSMSGYIPDRYGNIVEVYGPNLNQVVTIGAVHAQAGVQVSTGIANGTAGRASQANLARGTLTCTKNTNAATLVSTVAGTGPFANGYLIGAADVSDPSSGLATPAIVPGTTMTISGTAITLTPPSGYTWAVQESGTAIYCAACTWTLT